MEITQFKDLEIKEELQRAIEDLGYEQASPIQAKAIPAVLSGIDVIGQAQTGTGKTAAFGIPLLQRIDPNNKNLQAIVLCPTRELAIQVSEELRKLAKYLQGVKTLPVYGGQPIDRQIKALKSGVQVVIGTPGRVIDHINRRTLKTGMVNMVVLDEADEMLDMGFREDIETILSSVPEDRQTSLFSATMPKAILELTRKYQNNPEHIKVVRKELTVSNIKQFYIETRYSNKLEVLTRLIDVYNPKLSVVFTNTKKGADELVSSLQARGYGADSLHGDLKQAQRDIVMDKFRSGTIDILVATDVAARGIDVDDVECVFNYELPQDEEYYVHRIGRTGRAGRDGLAFSFAFGREMRKLKDIERYTKSKVMKHAIPTVNDVEQKRANQYFEEIKKILDEGNFAKHLQLVEDFLNEEDYSLIDVCAAIVKNSLGDEEKQEIKEESSDNRRNKNRSRNDADMTRLFLNVGRKQKVQAKDILGAIAGETGISSNKIGSIDIYDKYSFVDVSNSAAKTIIEKMKSRKIKGNKLNIERAGKRDNTSRKRNSNFSKKRDRM
ncbi:DEAD/DEAH box helicase [Peptostreptococcus equinus]|uniref:RNA helicase n=1 Tax=Peptostreptococcus equinus TaxID=3003601 RepID=A0ABY7JPB2_9FIRM|nr:DEAD/DEAH box helicase [Peptostreptococcus sp. CBA3647]WAW15204.1 DEAD/DEAH box helicase [Peptostreptococcus sp. CBA3647]